MEFDSSTHARIVSRASEAPKLWRDMTDAEKGALLLAHHEGKVIEWNVIHGITGQWNGWGPCDDDCLWDGEFSGDGFAYRVRPKQERKTVTLYGYDSRLSVWATGKRDPDLDTHRITFDLVDGEPDTDSIKMEKL